MEITEPLPETTTPSHAYFVLAMGIAAVSLAAIFIRLAQDETMPSFLIAGGRLVIAALLLTPAVFRRADYGQQLRSLSRRDLMLAIVSGVFLAIHFAAWVTSLEYTTVLISVVLVVTTSIWVGLLEVIFLNLRLSKPVILGLAIALIGGAVIALSAESGESDTSSTNHLLGAGLAVIGAIAVAIYMVIGRKLRAQLALTPYIWMVYGIAAIVMSVIIIFTGTPIAGHPANGYLWVLALGLIPQLVGHSSLNYVLAYLPATYVSLATQLEPVMSAIVAYFVFSEVPGIGQIFGGLIIITGVILANMKSPRS